MLTLTKLKRPRILRTWPCWLMQSTEIVDLQSEDCYSPSHTNATLLNFSSSFETQILEVGSLMHEATCVWAECFISATAPCCFKAGRPI